MKYKWCRKLGHKWIYSKMGSIELRTCRRCGTIEEHRRNIPAYGTGWFMLTQRTKAGGKNLLRKLSKGNQELNNGSK